MHSTTFVAALLAASASAKPLLARAPSGFQTVTSAALAPTATFQNATASSASAPGALLGVPTAQPNPPTPSGLVAKLLTEDTTVAKFKEIEADIAAGAIKLNFDFNPAANPAVKAGEGGQVDLANRANFPVLTGLGISAATIFFQPCGLNTPHIHPRATEFFTLVTDTKMETGFVLENGLADEFNTTLTQFQGTVFPRGSIHWQQNLDCKPAVGVAGLNAEDPGASSIAQNFLINTSEDIVDAALGFPSQIDGSNFGAFKKNIPLSLSKGVEECLVRCGIPH